MNIAIWHKALKVMPNISREEWDGWDFISKWLISTRAAMLIMTFISALLAGLFAWRDNSFNIVPWLALTFGLVMAHASNNLLNDDVDYIRGVDQKNYDRARYGVRPLVHGSDVKAQASRLLYCNRSAGAGKQIFSFASSGQLSGGDGLLMRENMQLESANKDSTELDRKGD